MRIISAQVSNFGSYKHLEFGFTNQGLTLISGPTGSGKSTLCDIIPWVLFGATAKGGKADEVRSWNTDESTTGTVEAQLNRESIIITRVRGGKANDLYYSVAGVNAPVRGKDIPDTQRLINQLLGIDADLYLSGAYYHEFSQASQFFTTTAKNRRQITEQMADLKLVKTLSTNLADYKKEVKKARDEAEKNKVLQENSIMHTERTLKAEQLRKDAWFTNHKLRIKELGQKDADFEEAQVAALTKIIHDHGNKTIQLRAEILDLEKSLEPDSTFAKKQAKLLDDLATLGDSHCDACGAPTEVQKRMTIQKALNTLDNAKQANERTKIAITHLEQRLEKHHSALEPLYRTEASRVNAYGEQLIALKKEKNPYSIVVLEEQLVTVKQKAQSEQATFTALSIELSDLELLADLTDDFRAACLSNTIRALQNKCNQLLTAYFDAEIKVKFTAEGADKLEVLITKDGNECSFTQLSKGQRQLLKLSFGVAVMEAVSNFQGIKFEQLFLDEALDGLDDNMKSKAFRLLENLALTHESVFCVEHSDAMKLLFTNRLNVCCTNGESVIEKAE